MQHKYIKAIFKPIFNEISPVSGKITEQRKVQRKEVSNSDRQRIMDEYTLHSINNRTDLK